MSDRPFLLPLVLNPPHDMWFERGHAKPMCHQHSRPGAMPWIITDLLLQLKRYDGVRSMQYQMVVRQNGAAFRVPLTVRQYRLLSKYFQHHQRRFNEWLVNSMAATIR